MEAKHTVGPWKVEPHEDGVVEGYLEEVITGPYGHYLATAECCPIALEHEKAGNIRLMSLAPEMAEMLRYLKNAFGPEVPHPYGGYTSYLSKGDMGMLIQLLNRLPGGR